MRLWESKNVGGNVRQQRCDAAYEHTVGRIFTHSRADSGAAVRGDSDDSTSATAATRDGKSESDVRFDGETGRWLMHTRCLPHTPPNEAGGLAAGKEPARSLQQSETSAGQRQPLPSMSARELEARVKQLDGSRHNLARSPERRDTTTADRPGGGGGIEQRAAALLRVRQNLEEYQ